MKLLILRSILATITISLCNCNNPNQSATITNQVKSIIANDTTAVLNIVFDTAFSRGNLTEIPNLQRNSPFGDTVVFIMDTSKFSEHFYSLFPADIIGTKYKFLSRTQICAQAIDKSFKDSSLFPNFLELLKFEKTDTGYSVFLQSTCVMPDFSNKKSVNAHRPSKCIFGLLCGGGIAIIVRKQGSNFIGKI